MSTLSHWLSVTTMTFTARDMELIKKRFMKLPEGKRMIITTEKDSVRLAAHPLMDEMLKPYIYMLPIEVAFYKTNKNCLTQI